MWIIFELAGQGAASLAFVINRPEAFLLDLPARPELGSLSFIDTLPLNASVEQALDKALRASAAPLVAVLANPDLVFDAELVQRVCSAANSVIEPDHIAVVASKCVDLWGNYYSGLYTSLDPHLPYCRSNMPVVDSVSDLFIVSRSHLAMLRAKPGHPPLASWAGWAVIEGYLNGRASFFSPHLAAGIYGNCLPRCTENHAETMCALIGDRVSELNLPSLNGALRLGTAPPAIGEQRVWRLAPLADLEKAIRSAILEHCERMSLSIVSRTQFKRPHLLRRMLTSISRWRQDEIDLEIVLSTDVDRALAEAEVEMLRSDFPALNLALAWNGDRKESSRVRNLLGGLAAAKKDYVAFVDDDDHVHFQSMKHLTLTRFMGAMPILFMDTELRNETWVKGAGDRWVLEATTFHIHYAGAKWREIFQGSNKLPICAAILPRKWTMETTKKFDFRHDYSEDFTLWLLLLQSPDLPLIVDIPRPFCIVSIRDDGTNTVTEQDRTRWVRDISLFLHDLHILHPLQGEGHLQTAIMAQAVPGAETRPTSDVGMRLRREIAVLRAENETLRMLLTQQPAEIGQAAHDTAGSGKDFWFARRKT